MQVAVDVAGFSAADADELRRAMGSKRSTEKMERLRGRFYAGMAANGIEGALADKIFDRMLAFANFGFPESHSISFASLVYYSAWFKLYHPSAFCAALLNAQPMGFYSPQSLVADARRHGVRVRGPDVNLGRAQAVLQPDAHSAGGQAVRLGLAEIRTIGEELAEEIDAERDRDGPYRDLADLARRVRLTVPQAEALATAGALGSFGVDRRAALWAAGVVAAVRPDQLPGTAVGLDAPALPGMTAAELTVADVWATGVSPDSHPIAHLRERLDRFGAVGDRPARRRGPSAAGDPDAPPRVLVGGLVTHRQRPATAGGVTFLNLEDETGMLNVTCSEGLWRALPDGGAGQRRPAGPRPAGTQRGGGAEPGGGPAGAAGARGAGEVARLPLTRVAWQSPPRPHGRLARARPTPETLLADDTEYTGLDLSDLVLDGPAAGGRVWRERRFVDCTVHDADLRGLVTERCTFDGCRFRGTDLGDSTHRGSAFRSCTFERTTLSGATLAGCSLLGSTVIDSRLRPLTLTDCDLTLAALGGVDLRRTDLSGLRLREANLVDADLREADLRGADLRGARLRGTRLDGADLRGARIDPTRCARPALAGATVDLETALAFAAAHGLRIG